MSISFTPSPGNPPSNLRSRVFLPVFVLACAVSLVYVFARDPVYVSTARLQVEGPKEEIRGKDADKLPSRMLPNLMNATQALTGSAVLDQLKPYLPPGQTGAGALRGMLSATPIPGSSVIELRAEGRERELPARVLGAWIDAYRHSYSEDLDRSSTAALEDARNALAALKQEVAAKRRDVEEFRRKYDIVSMERDENQTTARLRSLNEALNEAHKRQVNAEGRLNALRETVAAGKPVPEAPERAIILELERNASTLRDRMKDLEQEFTARYLALDSKYQGMRANLARIEQQIEQEKRESAGRALEKEEQEAQGARQAVARLQEELSGRKREAQEFTARFSENTAFEKELARLEETQEQAAQRVTQLELGRKGSRPALTVLDQPAVPERPDRPDYWRDALIAVAGAGALGFLAVWFVEFFKRSGVPRAEPAAQPVIHISFPPGVAISSGDPMIGVQASPALTSTAVRLPETIAPQSRELSVREVRDLWAAAMPDARLAIAALLGGISLEELAALHYEHVDFDSCYVRVPGVSGRSCTLRDPLRRLLLERRAARGGEAPLADGRGDPLAAADIDGLVTVAAHDAGVANAGEVTADTLRHTYFAYLVRQGARFAEIGEFIGRISPAAHREYTLLAPPGPGLPMEEIDPVFPALRDLPR